MFPQNVCTLRQAFVAGSNWFWNFIVARFTPQIFATMAYGLYWFLAALILCSSDFVWFLLPETKGMPLEAMDRPFSPAIAPRKAHATVMSELKADEEMFRQNVEGSGFAIPKERAVLIENM
jgi:hypothetical protein